MNRQILIIDDDEDDILFLKEALNKKGFTNLKLTMSAEDALEYLEKNKDCLPHLILTDIKMPITSGLDFIWTLKGKSTFKSIPIIAFSSSTAIADKDTALKAGAINFISKPQSAEAYREFAEKISEMIM